MNKKALGIALLLIHAVIIPIKADSLEISEDRIKQAQLNFSKSELTRNRIMVGSAYVATVGLGGTLWYYLTQKNELDKRFTRTVRSFDNLSEDQKREFYHIFNKQKNKNKKAWYEQSWSEFFKSSKGYLKIGVPFLIAELAKSYFWNQALSTLQYYLPSTVRFSDKFFSKRTISWFIEHNTSLIQVIISFNKEIRSEGPLKKEITESINNMLVTQLEKILGFMAYITNNLPDINITEKSRAETIKKDIIETSSLLNSIINNIEDNIEELMLKDQALILDYIQKEALIRDNIHKNLKCIIKNLRGFQEIDGSIGLQDTIDRNIFNHLDHILEPEKYIPENINKLNISDEETEN